MAAFILLIAAVVVATNVIVAIRKKRRGKSIFDTQEWELWGEEMFWGTDHEPTPGCLCGQCEFMYENRNK